MYVVASTTTVIVMCRMRQLAALYLLPHALAGQVLDGGWRQGASNSETDGGGSACKAGHGSLGLPAGNHINVYTAAGPGRCWRSCLDWRSFKASGALPLHESRFCLGQSTDELDKRPDKCAVLSVASNLLSATTSVCLSNLYVCRICMSTTCSAEKLIPFFCYFSEGHDSYQFRSFGCTNCQSMHQLSVERTPMTSWAPESGFKCLLSELQNKAVALLAQESLWTMRRVAQLHLATLASPEMTQDPRPALVPISMALSLLAHKINVLTELSVLLHILLSMMAAFVVPAVPTNSKSIWLNLHFST